MLTNEQKIKFYDILMKEYLEYEKELEDVEDSLASLSYEVPQFIEEMLYFLAGIYTPWENKFNEVYHDRMELHL